MLTVRARNIPRLDLLDDYRRIATQLVPFVVLTHDVPKDARDAVKALLRERGLPTSLREQGQRVVDSPDQSALVGLLSALNKEVGRIEIARIASFLHPNPRGASRMADRIVRSFREQRGFSVRSAVLGPGSGPRSQSLGRWLRDRARSSRRTPPHPPVRARRVGRDPVRRPGHRLVPDA